MKRIAVLIFISLAVCMFAKYNENKVQDSVTNNKVIKKGIPQNKELEKIIPEIYHAKINQLILDYKSLNDEKFYEKYQESMELDEIWFEFKNYKEANRNRDLLGTLIVFALTSERYIIQYDYKEELKDYIPALINHWGTSEVRIKYFILDNDQNYIAFVPKNSNIKAIYEVRIEDCEEE